jgi:hypothetical protein
MPPHVASGDVIRLLGVAVGAVLLTTDDEAPLVVGVPDAVAEDDVTILPEEERYQFASGSPRHSPTVTPR